MEVDNSLGYLKFDKTYRSNAKVYKEEHGGASTFSIYWFLLQFSNSGSYKVRKVFNNTDLEVEVERLTATPYEESLFYQLDVADISFVLSDYGIDNIFNGKVIDAGIVGKYVNLSINTSEVFELIE